LKANSITELRSHISTANQFKIIVILFLVIVLFSPTLLKLKQLWYTDADYSHGFLVIPISLFMVWQKRQKLLLIQIKPSWVGFFILTIGLLSYFIAFVTRFNILVYFSMILVIIGIVLFFTGWKVTKELLLPILFLLFMFPIPSSYYIMITNKLKLMITGISAQLMVYCGIPVHQDGNLLFFANTQLEVAEACSGVRSLYSYLMLSCLFAVLSNRLWAKFILIVSTVPLAIIVNIVRVTITGVLSNYYGSMVAQGFFHEFTGVILFIIGFFVFLIEYYLLEGRAITNKS
jgi:exosortase